MPLFYQQHAKTLCLWCGACYNSIMEENGEPPIHQTPLIDTSQKQTEIINSPKQIRKLNLILFIVSLVVPLLGLILWVVQMKQYKSMVFKISFVVASGIIATVVFFLGILIVFGGNVSIYYLALLTLFISNLPFIYTFIWPLGFRNRHQKL